MVQKIIQSGDPILRKVSKPVIKLDKKVLNLIKDLKDTLNVQKNPEGVGLAAPQIGVNLRVFVAKYKNLDLVAINPEIIKKTQKIQKSKTQRKARTEVLEGCLSLPHYYGPLKRDGKITLKYMDENGDYKTAEYSGFNAQIIMHEIDHLDGILFVDRLLEQKKKLYKLNAKDEWEEVEI